MAARRGGWPFPVPVSMASTFAALALAFGVVVGTAVSPNLSSLVAGGHLSEQLQAQAPTETEPAPDTNKKKGGGSDGSGSFDAGGFDTGGNFGSGFFGSTGSDFGATSTATPPAMTPGLVIRPTYLNGTVIHNNPVAGSYSIASGGEISAIHTKTSPKMPVPGAVVRVPVRRLPNGTFAEDGKRETKGESKRVTFTGVVTDRRDNIGPDSQDAYTVSGGGASVLVYSPFDTLGTNPPPPGVGGIATVTVDVKPPTSSLPVSPPPTYACAIPPRPYPNPPISPIRELQQVNLTLAANPVYAATIGTVVQAKCATPPAQFLLSSDDIRQGKADIAPFAGTGADLDLVSSAEPIVAAVKLTPTTNKVTEVTGTANDRGIKGAGDTTQAQGDLGSEAASAGQARTARRVARAASRSKR
jgi:hypothetical protein